jgi:hypothetical protein
VKRLNADTVSAVFLLLLTGVFFAATFEIRETSYGQMGSEVWPRLVLILLGVLSATLLLRSVVSPAQRAGSDGTEAARSGGGLAGWFARYRNAFICYGLFLLFLLTMPWLGMLIGGVLFVFLMLCALGGWQPRQLLIHALVAAASVGAMWAVFTFGLRVILPQGVIFSTL